MLRPVPCRFLARGFAHESDNILCWTCCHYATSPTSPNFSGRAAAAGHFDFLRQKVRPLGLDRRLRRRRDQAKSEGKQVLLNFTGSDWCVNCFRLDDEVFSKPEFADYARSHYVLVTLDFPIKKELSEKVTKQNTDLQTEICGGQYSYAHLARCRRKTARVRPRLSRRRRRRIVE